MLTKQDFEKLSELFSTKEDLDNKINRKLADFLPKIIKAQEEVFVTKAEYQNGLDEQRKDFANLQSSVDGFMKKVEREDTERLAMGSRIDRHEKWIKQAAGKVGVQFES